MSDISNEEEIALIPMTKEDLRVAIQALLDAPYWGLNRPTQLTDALGALQNGAIAAGWNIAGSQSFSPMVWTELGYEQRSVVEEEVRKQR